MFNSMSVYDILQAILTSGSYVRVGNQWTKEICYLQCSIANPLSMYKARKYSLNYFKREFQWYLNADPFDSRIEKFAKMWAKIRQPNGSIFSNYGQYWFGRQGGFYWVVECLRQDPNSRKAYIAMNNAGHAFTDNPDFVCTKGIQFRIIGRELHMHVAMRSSDAIYGLGTDLPCFYALMGMVANMLGVRMGEFIFSADSVHVYEKHFEMMDKIVDNGPLDIVDDTMPRVDDALDLIRCDFNSNFGKWLTTVSLDDETE